MMKKDIKPVSNSADTEIMDKYRKGLGILSLLFSVNLFATGSSVPVVEKSISTYKPSVSNLGAPAKITKKPTVKVQFSKPKFKPIGSAKINDSEAFFQSLAAGASAQNAVAAANSRAKSGLDEDEKISEEAYLDIDSGRAATVYSEPGHTYDDCQEQGGCKKLGWIQKQDTKIYVVRDKKGEIVKEVKKIKDPLQRSEIDEEEFQEIYEKVQKCLLVNKGNQKKCEEGELPTPDLKSKFEQYSNYKECLAFKQNSPSCKEELVPTKEVEYTKVKFEYERPVPNSPKAEKIKVSEVGWIESDHVSDKPLEDYVKKSKNKPAPSSSTKKEKCPEQQSPEQKNKSDLQRLNLPIATATGDAVEELAQVLDNEVGQCALNPRKKSAVARSGLLYDKHVLPTIERKKHEFPITIQTSLGPQKVSYEQFLNIDAMARTVYGEMSSCAIDKRIYADTCAKVIMNRSEVCQQGHAMCSVFQKESKQTEKNKPMMCQVMMAPYQFSVWNRGDNNNLRVLCPAKDNGKGTPNESAWNNSLETAVEAVLFPNEFKQKTREVKQFYYTSGIPFHAGYKKAAPVVEGRKIDSRSCMYVWQSPSSENLPD